MKLPHHSSINEREEFDEESDIVLETSQRGSSRIGPEDLHENLSKTMEQRYTKGIRIRTSSKSKCKQNYF